jgi:predicted dehydrogenase
MNLSVAREKPVVFDKPVNVAILGCGEIVRRAHLPGLLSRSGTACVPVIFGPDTASSHQLADDFCIPRLAHSLDAVFDAGDLDAVVIALPNHLHAPTAFAAISAGLPMLLEKPIASTIGMAREVVSRARQAGTRISMSLPHRQRPEASDRQRTNCVQPGTVSKSVNSYHKTFGYKNAPNHFNVTW